MEDKELLKTVSILKEIKPSQEWLLLTKQRILGIEAKEQTFSVFALLSYPSLFRISNPSFFRIFNLSYLKKPAFVVASLVLVLLGGTAIQARNSVPGDPLYVLKAAAENIQYVFSSSEEKQALRITMAQRRLEDLKKVMNSNDTQKLSFAIREFQQTANLASDDFAKLVDKEPARALQASRGIVQLQKDTSQVEKILGTIVEQKEEGRFENAVRTLIENEIADLETRTLREEQQELFLEAKDAFSQGDYQTALERIWALSNIQ